MTKLVLPARSLLRALVMPYCAFILEDGAIRSADAPRVWTAQRRGILAGKQ